MKDELLQMLFYYEWYAFFNSCAALAGFTYIQLMRVLVATTPDKFD